MPARIRLRRMGRKKRPHYRVVVADSTSPRDGRFVETLGYYKPLAEPARLVIDLARVDHWLSEGASPSGTVKSLIAKARRGGDATVAFGEEDSEAREAKRAEKLAARRAAEAKAAKAAEDAQAAETAAAEAAVAAEVEEAAPESESEVADVEAAAEPAAGAEGEPTAEAGADAEAEEATEEEKSE